MGPYSEEMSVTFLYFAYGSNLTTSRLVERCRSAKFVGLASVAGYQLEFTKLSKKDKSGKGNIVAREGSIVHGVLFQISLAERGDLDKAEGGYRRDDNFIVTLDDGKAEPVTTYIAKDRVEGLVPYSWYLRLITDGGTKHGLPKAYLDELGGVVCAADMDGEREKRELAYLTL